MNTLDVRLDGGIQNTLSKLSEDFTDYYELYKIKTYMEVLNSDFVDEDIKHRIKKQLNKEIIRLILFEEEYDEWYKENMF